MENMPNLSENASKEMGSETASQTPSTNGHPTMPVKSIPGIDWGYTTPTTPAAECECALYMKDNDGSITFPDCPAHGKGGDIPACDRKPVMPAAEGAKELRLTMLNYFGNAGHRPASVEYFITHTVYPQMLRLLASERQKIADVCVKALDAVEDECQKRYGMDGYDTHGICADALLTALKNEGIEVKE